MLPALLVMFSGVVGGVPGSWKERLKTEVGKFAKERENITWFKIKLHWSINADILIFIQLYAFKQF